MQSVMLDYVCIHVSRITIQTELIKLHSPIDIPAGVQMLWVFACHASNKEVLCTLIEEKIITLFEWIYGFLKKKKIFLANLYFVFMNTLFIS
jgi:hypothetical protein